MTHTLEVGRQGHVSWETEEGIYLIGGRNNEKYEFHNSSVLVKPNNVTTNGFHLKYLIRYLIIVDNYAYKVIIGASTHAKHSSSLLF